MLLFDIGANRGDAVEAGLQKGYKVIALEPAPKVYAELIRNYIYNPNVIPLKFAVSNSNNQEIEFYECVEDGLSTMEKSWLTDPSMPYNGKEYRAIKANTITLDSLVDIYGIPYLIKIDVEGAEWFVFKGMTKKYNTLTFEWTIETVSDHIEQLKYLRSLGYTEYGPQFIEHHLQEPDHWFSLDNPNLDVWIAHNEDIWTDKLWMRSGLRPTADVGMCWVR